MTTELVRMQQNLHAACRGFSLRQLYTIARAIADELTTRELDASLEARALECALLPLARTEQLSIFSGDCATERVGDFNVTAGYYSRAHPTAPAPAES